MPGQDKTGPLGQGPLTGRGLGPCGGGYARGFGRGCGRGRGFGRGFGFRQVTLTKEEEKKILESELQQIEAEKQDIAKRLNELK